MASNFWEIYHDFVIAPYPHLCGGKSGKSAQSIDERPPSRQRMDDHRPGGRARLSDDQQPEISAMKASASAKSLSQLVIEDIAKGGGVRPHVWETMRLSRCSCSPQCDADHSGAADIVLSLGFGFWSDDNKLGQILEGGPHDGIR